MTRRALPGCGAVLAAAMLVSATPAGALTLDEAVARAAEVNPHAVVAELEARARATRAHRRWTTVLPDLGLRQTRTLVPAPASPTVERELRATWDIFDGPEWLEASRDGADAEGQRAAATATRLDAQYAAAALYFEALAAEGRVTAARTSAQVAESTLSTTRTQAQAGVTDELTYRSAELGAIAAKAALAQAEADVVITRATLERALQEPLEGPLTPNAPLHLPEDELRSPWLDAQRASVRAAHLDTLTAWAEVLPTASLRATRPIGVVADTWTTELQLRWDLDGGVAPFLEAREKSLARQAREVELDALERDLRLGVRVARERAGAANIVAEAARAREQLADSSVTLAQTRLAAGVARPLEVLRLQDDAATARLQRVDAERDAALATLEARRLAGVPWGTP